ncbi:MAG TPA: DUF1501 domain-containing protein [Gemmatimonadales bacterium]|nr:DUF1501 domain-containing protein [Gemmatimonadales bacterium]
MTICNDCSAPGVGVSRRHFLRFGLGAAAASAAGIHLPAFAQDQDTVAGGSGKSVIVLWMGGGPSQLDTWDPKPGQKTGGPTKAIDTAVRGIQLAQPMERIAKQMKHISLMRAMTTMEAAHDRGAHLLHTCFAPIPGQDFAAMGTVVAAELTRKDFPLPSYVAVSPATTIPQSSSFGEEYQAFTVNNVDNPVPNVMRSGGVSADHQQAREELLDSQNEEFEGRREGREVEKVRTAVQKAEDLMTTPLLKAFDVKSESEELRKEYGGYFGQNCLLARRLVQAGVKFVEVGLGGWDTHVNNFDAVSRNVREQLDPGMGTLIKDLAEKGMLKDTIVLWMGEFGRTPEINGTNGRDHWCKAFSVAMAGGGVGGRLVGSTDKTGMEIQDRPVTVPELFATVYRHLGIPENNHYIVNQRKVKYSYGGKPIKELL